MKQDRSADMASSPRGEAHVRTAQERLQHKGFDPGPIDGYLGSPHRRRGRRVSAQGGLDGDEPSGRRHAGQARGWRGRFYPEAADPVTGFARPLGQRAGKATSQLVFFLRRVLLSRSGSTLHERYGLAGAGGGRRGGRGVAMGEARAMGDCGAGASADGGALDAASGGADRGDGGAIPRRWPRPPRARSLRRTSAGAATQIPTRRVSAAAGAAHDRSPAWAIPARPVGTIPPTTPSPINPIAVFMIEQTSVIAHAQYDVPCSADGIVTRVM